MIDKIAWLHPVGGRILSVAIPPEPITPAKCSKRKRTAEYTGTLKASSEIEEVVWLTYADRDRVSAVDKLIFDHLHGTGQLG